MGGGRRRLGGACAPARKKHGAPLDFGIAAYIINGMKIFKSFVIFPGLPGRQASSRGIAPRPGELGGRHGTRIKVPEQRACHLEVMP
jgi:hypothetical protein